MKLVLIDGGPASGKNTLGVLLVQALEKQDSKAILFDLDTYVEKINPTWTWEEERIKNMDLENARVNFAKDIDKYLQLDFEVITIGERFLTKADVANFISRLKSSSPTYLYHLSVPFSLRTQRLRERGPHSLIDLDKDQRDRDSNIKWYGYIYENMNSPEKDAVNIMKLIQNNKGLLDNRLYG